MHYAVIVGVLQDEVVTNNETTRKQFCIDTPCLSNQDIVTQLACNSLDNDIGTWLFSGELPNGVEKSWFNYIFAGPRNITDAISRRGNPYKKISTTTLAEINKTYMAISALRTQQKQENECAKCSGIVYRQTDSGKIIPVGQRCGAKITPPCYVPDGDGCAYQIYGDNNDEPIDRCKSCPLCQSDKIRHKQESVHNDPLVLDELRQMRGEPVWCKELECYGIVKMEKVGSWANELFLVGTWHNGDAAVNFEYDIKSRGLTLYRHKPEEGMV